MSKGRLGAAGRDWVGSRTWVQQSQGCEQNIYQPEMQSSYETVCCSSRARPKHAAAALCPLVGRLDSSQPRRRAWPQHAANVHDQPLLCHYAQD
jgi:hypothetical protein